MTTPSAPDPQGTQDNEGGEGLLLGKYKTPEELVAAFKEQQKENSRLAEQLKAEQSINKLLQDLAPPEGKQQPQSTEKFVSGHWEPADQPPSGLFDEEQLKWMQQRESKLVNAVVSGVNRIIDTRDAQKKAVDRFFSENPDLVGNEDIVQMEAVKLDSELGPRAASNPEALKLIAKRARARIEELKAKKRGSPPHVERGTSVATEETPPEPNRDPSEKDKVDDYVSDWRSLQNKRMGLTR